MIKKLFRDIVWEYFPVFMMLIVISIMAVLEYHKVDNTSQLESCDTPTSYITPIQENWEQ